MSIWLTLRASFPSAVEAGPKKARFIPNSAQISTPICCAWGGIQGEPERPEDLHRQVTGYARDVFPDLPLQFIRLGDLVDPGPASCEVISYLMEFEAQFSPRPVTLRGNHGQMTIDAAGSGERYPAGRRSWIMNGRQETLESYVGQPRPLMKRRRAWLGSLPTLHEAEAAGQVFVPAGVDPQRFPAFGETCTSGRGGVSSRIRARSASAWYTDIRQSRFICRNLRQTAESLTQTPALFKAGG